MGTRGQEVARGLSTSLAQEEVSFWAESLNNDLSVHLSMTHPNPRFGSERVGYIDEPRS